MAVVGAGVIGIEYASIFAALGVAVTLVERRDRPLEFLDREIVDELLHQMREPQRHAPASARRSSRSTIAGGPAAAGRRSPSSRASGSCTDMVLFSAGRVAATDALNLPAAGLDGRRARARSRGRVASAPRCRTSSRPGDVIGYPSLAATSSEQGRPAACAAFGVEAGPMARALPDRHLLDPRDLHGGRAGARADRRRRSPTRRAWPATARSRAGRSSATTAACSRCCSTARTAGSSASTASAPAPPSWCTSGRPCSACGGGLDYFLQHGLQLSDPGRVLQGRGPRRLEQAAAS